MCQQSSDRTTDWQSVIKRQPWFDESKETLVVLLLSTRYIIDGYSLVSIGTLNESFAHPREIFRAAIVNGSYGIVVMHNHPSGDAWPSEQDHLLTRRLSEAADVLQIRLLDHVIVGRRKCKALPAACCRDRKGWKPRDAHAICRRGFYSFKEAGRL